MKLQRAILLSMVVASLGGAARGQNAVEQQNPNLEERKFDFQQKLENKKLVLERDKLVDERQKNSIATFSLVATAGSIMAALFVGAATIYYQFRLKKYDFEIKAAEIIMQVDSPLTTRGKADALARIFPRRLPKNFATKFDATLYGDGYQLTRDPHAKNLTLVPRELTVSGPSVLPPDITMLAAAAVGSGPTEAIGKEWAAEIQARRNLYLSYVYQVSKQPGQKYDVTIFLKRHVWGPDPDQRLFLDVERAEFYFGPSWRSVFIAAPVDRTGGIVGVRISAWGSFWATCRVKLKGDPGPVMLHHHIDFEMPPYEVA